MLNSFPIQHLLPGQTAEIAELRGQPHSVSRLYEIGFRVGAPLKMLQTGRACVVRVNGAKLCLRTQGVQVLVQPC